MFEEATEGKNMVEMVVVEKQPEIVTLACQQSLAHQLLDHPGQLSGAWLALTVSVVVMLLNKISKGDKANNVSVGLCQARLLALLSHLALRVVGTVGREVWGEELELPPIDLVEETEIIYKYLFWRLKRPGRLSRGRKGRTSWRSC